MVTAASLGPASSHPSWPPTCGGFGSPSLAPGSWHWTLEKAAGVGPVKPLCAMPCPPSRPASLPESCAARRRSPRATPAPPDVSIWGQMPAEGTATPAAHGSGIAVGPTQGTLGTREAPHRFCMLPPQGQPLGGHGGPCPLLSARTGSTSSLGPPHRGHRGHTPAPAWPTGQGSQACLEPRKAGYPRQGWWCRAWVGPG